VGQGGEPFRKNAALLGGRPFSSSKGRTGGGPREGKKGSNEGKNPSTTPLATKAGRDQEDGRAFSEERRKVPKEGYCEHPSCKNLTVRTSDRTKERGWAERRKKLDSVHIKKIASIPAAGADRLRKRKGMSRKEAKKETLVSTVLFPKRPVCSWPLAKKEREEGLSSLCREGKGRRS